MSSLLVVEGSPVGIRYPIGEELTIGRAPGATIILVDLQVSRLHAAIRRQDDRLVLIDASSRNGTFLNGERIFGPRVLRRFDELRIGLTRMVLDADEEILVQPNKLAFCIVNQEALAAEWRSTVAPSASVPDTPFPLSFFHKLNEAGLRSEECPEIALLELLNHTFGSTRSMLLTAEDSQFSALAIYPPDMPAALNAGALALVSQKSAQQFRARVPKVDYPPSSRRLWTADAGVLSGSVPLSDGRRLLGWFELDNADFHSAQRAKLDAILPLIGKLIDHRQLLMSVQRSWEVDSRHTAQLRLPARALLEYGGRLHLAQRVASHDSAVVIVGGHGTGKNRVAAFIHRLSRRRYGPLVRVNCAETRESHLETHLFGTESPCYPGALESGHLGIVVLEHLEALPPRAQDALYRAITSRRCFRLGGTNPIDFDVRIIATAAQPLAQAVEARLLRADLVAMLGNEALQLLKLAEMRENIPLMAQEIVNQLVQHRGVKAKQLTAAATNFLRDREWTLDVWELEDLLGRALALAEGHLLTRDDIEMADVHGNPSHSDSD